MASSREYQMLFQLSASMGGGFQSTFSSGQKAITDLQNGINALNKTQSDISAYTKQQAALDKSKEKLALYQSQLERLKGVEAGSANEAAHLANEIEAKQMQVNNAQAAVDKNNAKLDEMGNALREAGVDTNNLAGESERLKAETESLAAEQVREAQAAEEQGRSLQEAMEGMGAALETLGMMKGLEKVYSALSECSTAAAQFETAMAGVKRTVGGSDSFIDSLGESFKEMSTTMPITASELAGIATTAGQLGIAQDNVEEFTTVMAQLATTTDLSADNAATMLAQFSNITGVTDYQRLGSTVASLGDATATTASKVVEMSQGMAAAASMAGMSETDILAISAAVGSLGIEAASGSTSMSTLISTLYKATETGNNLKEFASVAGMSATEFKHAWATDAVGALDSFIQGLNDTERNGKSAVAILEELGINNVRQTKAILGLASAGDLLSNTVAQANSAWASNTALTEKASIMYETTEAKMTMMQNAANNVQVAIGDALNPTLSGMYDAATSALQPIAEFIEANPAIVQAITSFVGVLGIAAVGITAVTAATKLWATANTILGASLPGIGMIVGIAAAVGGLVGVISAVSGASGDASKSMAELTEEYNNLIDQMDENQKVIDLVDSYQDLNEEAENLQKLMSKDFTTKVSFTGTVNGVDKLKPTDFVDGDTVTLSAEQARLLAANSFLDGSVIELTPEQAQFLGANEFLTTTTVTLTPEQAKHLASSEFLTDTTVKITPEQAKQLQSSQFLKSTKVQLTPEQKKLLKSAEFIDGTTTITLTPEQAQKLAAAGFLDGTTVELTPTQANLLAADGFLDGTEVPLTAEAANALAAEGYFTDGTVVKLEATKANQLKASEFMAEQTITFTGEAGNTLSAADFGLSDQTLIYIAQMDDPSYDAVVAKAKELGKQLAQAKTDVTTAQSKLSSMQTEYSNLETKIAGEKNKKKKAALTEQLEELGDAITEQAGNVEQLETKYDNLEAEYTVVATAASELTGNEEALLAAKQALSAASGDLITASENETEAFNQQAAAAKDAADANNALLRSKLYDNASQQAKAYAATAQQAAEAQANYNAASERAAVAQKYAGMSADEVNTSYQSLLTTLDQMESSDGWTPDSQEYAQAVAEVEHLMSLMTGMDMSGIQADADRLSDGMVNWADSFGYLTTNGEMWNDSLEFLNAAIAEYKSEMDSAEESNRQFISNLVNAISTGAMTEAQVRAMLTNALEGEADAADTVNRIMADVNSQMNAEAEAAQVAAEGTHELADATDELNGANDTGTRTMEEIIADINTLVKSYDDAYKAAKESMEGQFKLFEDAKTVTAKKNGASGYVKNLEDQNKYIEQYTQNYETAAAALQAAEAQVVGEGNTGAEGASNSILSQLADGSAESAQILADLAAAAPEDVQAIVEAYANLEGTRDQYATTVAEIETNFSEGMTTLEEELATTVAELDFSDEAASEAQAAMSAFVSSIEAYVGPAGAAAARVAAAISAALKIKYPTIHIPGFASGTDDANRGFAVVGEEGPELVWFNGGEKVLNASETKALQEDSKLKAEPLSGSASSNGGGNASDGGIHIDFSPVYYVGSGVNADEIQTVLEEHDENLRDKIQEIMEDINSDETRRRYA